MFLGKARSFLFELTVLERRTKFLGKCTEIASTTTKTFSTVEGQFEAFFVYKLKLFRDESSPKQQVFPRFRHFFYLVKKSIDILTKIEPKS